MIVRLLRLVLPHVELAGWATVLILAVLGATYAEGLRHARRADAERAQAASARQQAAQAQAQTRLDRRASAAVLTASRRETDTLIRSDHDADTLARAPGSDQPLAEDLLRGWGAAINSLRDQAARARSGPGVPAGDEPAPRPLPPPGAAEPSDRG